MHQNFQCSRKGLQVSQKPSSRKIIFSRRKKIFNQPRKSAFNKLPENSKESFIMPKNFFTIQEVAGPPRKFSSTAEQFQPFTTVSAPKNYFSFQKRDSVCSKSFQSIKTFHHLQKNLITIQMYFSVRNKMLHSLQRFPAPPLSLFLKISRCKQNAQSFFSGIQSYHVHTIVQEREKEKVRKKEKESGKEKLRVSKRAKKRAR